MLPKSYPYCTKDQHFCKQCLPESSLVYLRRETVQTGGETRLTTG